MPRINFIEQRGEETSIDAPVGYTVMEVAIRNGLSGISADCGGVCTCATCHVHVDDAARFGLEAASVTEKALLEFASDVDATSRLSCQIKITEAMDGLVVRMPDSQG